MTHLTTDDVPLPAEIGPRVREFRRLMMNYKFGIDEVMTKITVLRDEFRHVHDDNPIEHLGSRLKSLESIVAKARRKGSRSPRRACGRTCSTSRASGSRARSSPTSTACATCSLASATSRSSRSATTSRTRRATATRACTIVQVPVFLSDRVEDVVVEIQLRTIAMDFWASLEHKIYYKYQRDVPQHLTDALKLAADVAATLDTTMERIHDEVRSLDGVPEPVENTDELATPREVMESFMRTAQVADEAFHERRHDG